MVDDRPSAISIRPPSGGHTRCTRADCHEGAEPATGAGGEPHAAHRPDRVARCGGRCLLCGRAALPPVAGSPVLALPRLRLAAGQRRGVIRTRSKRGASKMIGSKPATAGHEKVSAGPFTGLRGGAFLGYRWVLLVFLLAGVA